MEKFLPSGDAWMSSREEGHVRCIEDVAWEEYCFKVVTCLYLRGDLVHKHAINRVPDRNLACIGSRREEKSFYNVI
ncbi:hypothetical protein E2C01_057913 [Portunus trituberculatus]|uniref:Uncharacterized protein n=1 Tax=Portunus trituberculatus TaxID=210409 RepID=A0A5B7H391_PORTR|nr:hypothetical protein [Portunus trituberculatus]